MDNVAQFSATLISIPVTLKLGATAFVGHNSGLWPALRLGFKSRMFRSSPLSARTGLVASVEKEMRSLQYGEFIVVTGRHRVGKSCLIDTVISRKSGVVKILLSPTQSDRDIRDAVLTAVSWAQLPKMVTLERAASRATYIYRLLFRTRPTIVLQLHQFMYNGNAVVGATRYFAENGYQVIVDVSATTSPAELDSTGRATTIVVPPMTLPEARAVVEFAPLFVLLEAHPQIQEMVVFFADGLPGNYTKLAACHSVEEVLQKIWQWTNEDYRRIQKFVLTHQEFDDIVWGWRNVTTVDQLLPTEPRVFRTEESGYAACSSTMDFVLQHGKVPAPEDLPAAFAQYKLSAPGIHFVAKVAKSGYSSLHAYGARV
eukprot:TRINITY_DN4439_c0_g1_i1.p1 TRINITY_DN4439_c0_g1~~TRINITY_DN4439_c0_g1_i1.p1  ORF type:complete len:392 (-),score=40.35 TRINITY_DN4439_c0_g1_i1:166-1278(-)